MIRNANREPPLCRIVCVNRTHGIICCYKGGKCKIGAAGKRAMVGSLGYHHATVFRGTDKGYWPAVEHLLERTEQEKYGQAISIARSNAVVSGKRAVFIYERAFAG